MKKRKHKQWHQPREAAARKNLPSPKVGRAGMRRTSWLGGVGLVLLVGFFALQRFRSPTFRPAPKPGMAGEALDPSDFGAFQLNHSPPKPASAVPVPPNESSATPVKQAEDTADKLSNQGLRLLSDGDAKQAIKYFEQALALSPKDEDFHFNLGVALAKTGDLTNAETQYKEALRLLPDYPEAHNNYGNVLARLGRLDEAEEQLKEAIEQVPDSATFNNSLGVLHQRRKQTNEALFCFQKAVQCDSNFLEGHFNLAEAYFGQKDRQRAIAELHEALRIKPGFEPAQRALARVTGQEPASFPAGGPPLR